MLQEEHGVIFQVEEVHLEVQDFPDLRWLTTWN
jgi:hypothetical protein